VNPDEEFCRTCGLADASRPVDHDDERRAGIPLREQRVKHAEFGGVTGEATCHGRELSGREKPGRWTVDDTVPLVGQLHRLP